MHNKQTLQAAQQLLAQLGISADDLLGVTSATPPTFRTYLGQLRAAVPAATLRCYDPYWKKVEDAWGDRTIDEPSSLEIRRLCEQASTTATIRRNSRNGRGATENMVGALRCIYRHAEADRYLRHEDNPAAKVPRPRRLPSTRRALAQRQLEEIINIASTTGNDPDLDLLLLRFHIETACRRGGALGLRIKDLDDHNCCVQLREKGGTVRWQPVSPTLMLALKQHITERVPDGAPSSEPALRYRTGRPITGRRYDSLWDRIGRHLPWVAQQGITAHWLRHTTLTWVERTFGYAVAHAYAGHTDNTADTRATITYIRASLEEVAHALAALTGEPHPLAPGN